MRKRIRGLRRDPEDRLNPFRIAPPPSSNWLPAPPLNSRSSQISYDQLTQGLYSARLLSLDVVAGHAGVEWRFPFLDRRLIDFMLGVPPRLRFGNGVIKRILRRALAGVLPEQVGQRVSFAHFSELQDRGLREKERDRIRALLKDSLVVRLGYAQEKPLLDAWESYWRGAVPSQGCGHLVAGLCLEAWLRARPGAGRA
jgi:asparagine synthase (glutamine-hydrolysing)